MIILTNDEAAALVHRLTATANALDGVRAGSSLDGADHARLYDAARAARECADVLRPASRHPNPSLISTPTAS